MTPSAPSVYLARLGRDFAVAGRPADEERRLSALQRYAILDTSSDAAFDRIARIAARLFGAPIALISLVDRDRLDFKARCGLDAVTIERDVAFCAHAVLGDAVFLVRDTAEDPRFAQNPLLTGAPHARFYAGAPLTTPDGFNVGTLCVIDTVPRPAFDHDDCALLQDLAAMVIERLEAGYAARDLLSVDRRRQETRKRLATAENMLRLFIEQAPTAIAILDTELRYLAVSRRWLSDLRLNEDDVIGRGHADLFGAAAAPWQDRLGACLAGAPSQGGADRLQRPDGSVAWVRWQLRPWQQADGAPGGVVMFTEIVTDRLRTERQLRDNVARSRALYHNTPVMLHSIDAERRIIAVSDYWLAMLGYDRREVIGRKPTDFMTPASRKYADEVAVPDFTELGRCADVALQFAKKHGGHLDVLVTATSERDAEGRLVCSHAVLVDVTEKNEAQAALRQSERQLRLIADALPILICNIDRDLRYRFLNRTFAQWLKATPEEAEGKKATDVLPPEMRAGLQPHLEAALRGERRDLAVEITYPDGQTRQVEGNYLPVVDDAGRVDSVVATGTDTTERKATEAQLRQAQKMEAVGHLTGGLAHDFNNLLAIVLGNLQLLERRMEQDERDERARRRVRAAVDAAKRGAELTARLLAFSRRQRLAPKVIDLNQLIGGMKTLLRRTLGETIELAVVGADDLWPTKIDPSQVETAILNLAINARDAMPDGGWLRVETSNACLDAADAARNRDAAPGCYVVIAVSDTGVGIPAALQDKVFQPFFTTKEVGEGSGLGLSMVYGFVKQSGGHVRTRSTPGEGTTIEIFLPRATAAGMP